MDIYIIRHANAVKVEDWNKNDLQRPLTKKGMVKSKAAFKRFLKKFKKPNIIISSEALRSKHTAEILNEYCNVKFLVDKRLNPGATIDDYHSVISENSKFEIICLTGHEPDISSFISDYLTEGKLQIILKKGSIIHIRDGSLINLVQQKILL
jgi:phosphohistidine phosphatase SixA